MVLSYSSLNLVIQYWWVQWNFLSHIVGRQETRYNCYKRYNWQIATVALGKSSEIFLYGIRCFFKRGMKALMTMNSINVEWTRLATMAPGVNTEKGLGAGKAGIAEARKSEGLKVCNQGRHIGWTHLLSDIGYKVAGRKTSCGKGGERACLVQSPPGSLWGKRWI